MPLNGFRVRRQTRPFVIPAKAGIQRGGVGCGNDTRTLPPTNAPNSYLRVPAPAGMRDCYESMSRTPIRDRPLQQPLIGHSRHPFVNPAPHSSFRQSKACPVPRYGTGIQKGGREATSSPPGRGLTSLPRTPIRGEGEPHSTGASSHPRIPDSSPFLPPHVALARS